MTPQELFSTAYIALRDRGFTRAGRETPDGNFVCAYRALDGSRCAIGLVITDEEYKYIEEGLGVNTIRKHVAALEGLDSDFLIELQDCHDYGTTPERMWKSLQSFAERNGLEIPQ